MVTVTDVQRGLPRVLTSDNDGGYSAPNLIPGAYTVRVEAKGFNTVQRQDIVVEVGTDVRVDLTLQPGSQAQVVTVTGEPPMIDTQSATLGGIVENQAINELPLNGKKLPGTTLVQTRNRSEARRRHRCIHHEWRPFRNTTFGYSTAYITTKLTADGA